MCTLNKRFMLIAKSVDKEPENIIFPEQKQEQ